MLPRIVSLIQSGWPSALLGLALLCACGPKKEIAARPGEYLYLGANAQIEPTLQGIENLSIKLNNLITATRRTQKKEKRYSR